MKRTVLVVDDEQNMQTVMRMGEAEFSPMHLMCIGAAERVQPILAAPRAVSGLGSVEVVTSRHGRQARVNRGTS